MQIDPEFKSLIPPLRPEEKEALEASIKAEGCRDPIIAWGDIILDGHNRYEICQRLGINFETKNKEFENRNAAKLWIVCNQLARRNLSDFARFELIKFEQELLLEKGKQQMAMGGRKHAPLTTHHRTRECVAEQLNWPLARVERASYVEKHAPEPIKNELRAGNISINEALKEIKKEERAKEIASIPKTAILPDGMYDVIAIDPPWPYGTAYDPAGRRAASPYPEMGLDDIKKISLPAAQDCILFLWTTHKFMRPSFDVLDAWGFREVAIITWVKNTIGLGSWLRSQSEFCIMAVRGHPHVSLTNQSTVLIADRREHSRKPDEFYSLVDSLCGGRKLDYFAREPRAGWDTFGWEEKKYA